MGSKKYFQKEKSNKVLVSKNLEEIGKEVESARFIKDYVRQKDRFEPHVDFGTASNFAKYGLAEKYYEDSVDRIYKTYPYDGSLREKVLWDLSSSFLDKWVFKNKYPRTNGFVDIGYNYSGESTLVQGYGSASKQEFIQIKGGPNAGFDPEGTRSVRKYKNRFANSNIYKASKNRTSNLRFNLSGTNGSSSAGVTVEFWMKKRGYSTTTNTAREVIFDLWNGIATGSSGHGRLTIELDCTASNSPFRVTLLSGTATAGSHTVSSSNAQRLGIGQNLVKATVANSKWQHYAFSFQQTGSGDTTTIKFYVSGTLNDTKVLSTGFKEVSTGSLIANIGALRTTPSGGNASIVEGWGKLSASLDEFRYWKTTRSEKQIKRYYLSDVAGGSNSEDENTDLGVYYKFNEGITTTSSVDAVVLDYSGRVTNGVWTGYAAGARSTGSAIVQSSASLAEFKDPIIYSFHPDVVNLRTALAYSGSAHDRTNNACIYYSLPAWISEEDESEGGVLKNLAQVMSSYFDSLHLQIESLTNVKNINYNSKYKPLPFASRLLESAGFIAPEIMADATVLEQFDSRNEERLFSDNLYNVKNQIYQNIYNNLSYIYKTKGTEKSFRNLIRCFGIDEDLIKVNLYADNTSYEFRDNLTSISKKKKYIDFNKSDHFAATVYQMTASGDSTNTKSYLSGGITNTEFIPFTTEAEFLFPRKFGIDSKHYFNTSFVTSSLFGMHTVDRTEVQSSLNWNVADSANFQVYAIKKGVMSNTGSADVYFMLSSSVHGVRPGNPAGNSGIVLTSSVYKGVYDNQKWNFAVRFKPAKYPAAGVWGSTGSLEKYDLEFYGVNVVLDEVTKEFSGSTTVNNEFLITASLTNAKGKPFAIAHKRLYAGAHRQDFTGSVLKSTDVKLGSVRHWADFVPTSSIQAHVKIFENYGRENPYKSAHLMPASLSGNYIPQAETLALYWNFSQVTSSDASGRFFVEDVSSGSSNAASTRYDWYGGSTKFRHTGRGQFFLASSTSSVDNRHISTTKQKLPEFVNSSNMVKILRQDDDLFTKSSRPSKYLFAIEKSMYQNISEEILKTFSSVKAFNDLIGDPVYKYRSEYKSLAKVRQRFFENVKNEADFDRFYEFYKWLDDALSEMIMQLVPASAKFSHGVWNTIESHVLERNKVQHQFPLVNKKEATEAGVEGVWQLGYNWREGHHPTSFIQNKNSLWWNQRSIPTHPNLSSSDGNITSDREKIYDIKRQVLDRIKTTPYRFVLNTRNSPIHGGINFSNNKNLDYLKPITEIFGPIIPSSKIPKNVILAFKEDAEKPKDTYGMPTKDAQKHPVPGPVNGIAQKEGVYDRNQLKYKTKVTEINKYSSRTSTGEKLFPFNLYSSSVATGYNSVIVKGFMSGVQLTNLHHDTYGSDKEVPMQGPFTEKHVGGRQHRHVDLNLGSDTWNNRPEAFKVLVGVLAGSSLKHSGAIGVVGPDYPMGGPDGGNYPQTGAAYFRNYRDEFAKRPVNIRNIKTSTGSMTLGNYTKNYEIVQTSGRRYNNKEFNLSGGISYSYTTASNIAGVVNFKVPIRKRNESVFVERFSAPGGPEVNSIGFLDLEAAEYSVYNALPYRNLSVRGPLRELLTQHAGPFGFSSFGNHTGSWYRTSATASYHKIYRNRLQIIKGGEPSAENGAVPVATYNYDNWYVQRPIPRSDLQYSWINASCYATSSAFTGYTSASYDDYQTGISYLTSSEIATASVKVDFAGLNALIYDPVTSSQNILSSALGLSGYTHQHIIKNGLSLSHSLNALNLHRNGPYNWPIFKQIRGGEGPVNRYHRKNNIFSIVDPPKEIIEVSNGKRNIYYLKNHTQTQHIEPVFSTRYRPLVHDLKTNNTQVIVKHAYGNNISSFGNEKINDRLSYRPKTAQAYDKLKSLYIGSSRNFGTNAIDSFNSLVYRENIYPKEKFHGINKVRSRTSYVEEPGAFGQANLERRNYIGRSPLYRRTFWAGPSKRSIFSGFGFFGDPIASDVTNSVGFNNLEIIDELLGGPFSVWPLDVAYYPSASVETLGGYQYPIPNRISFDADSGSAWGELHPQLWAGFTGKGAALEQALFINHGIIRQFGDPNVKLYINTDTTASLPYDPDIGADDVNEYHTVSPQYCWTPYLGKHTEFVIPWQVAKQSGKDPWYASYADYSADLRALGKDYTIIPEFKISDHMEYYVSKKGGNFLSHADREGGFFRLEGALYSGSADESGNFNKPFWQTYMHSDFMKHFCDIKKDHESSHIKPSRVSLTCKAIKKLLPYNGFYPVLRTVQLAQLLSQSVGPYIRAGSTSLLNSGSKGQKLSPLLQPFFMPGVVFNTIKSGLAVDFPIYTSSMTSASFASGITRHVYSGKLSTSHHIVVKKPHFRLSFEDAIDFNLPTGSNIHFVAPTYILGYTGSSDINGNGFNYPNIRWTGTKKPMYSMAMNNFLGESVKFFLKDKKLKSFYSKPEKGWKSLEAGTAYYMTIKLKKTDGFDMIKSFDFNTPASGGIAGTPIKTYDGRYFGYPMMTCSIAQLSKTGKLDNRAYNCADPAYAHVTPPYFYGDAKATLRFTPSSTRKYTLDEILAGAEQTVTYSNQRVTNPPVTGSLAGTGGESTGDGLEAFSPSDTARVSQMHLDSSLNIFGIAREKKVKFDPQGNPISVSEPEGTDLDRWVISTKYECPTLNFADSPPTLPTASKATPMGKGMWMTYGDIVSGSDEGIFMSLEDTYKDWRNLSDTGSLIDVCGFKYDDKRIGELADSTIIEEAIVAVPFLERKTNDTVTIAGRNFIKINPDIYFTQKSNISTGIPAVEKGQYGASLDIPQTSISKMIEKMKKYYFPPFMDFDTFEMNVLANTNIRELDTKSGAIPPYVAYIFEFSTELDTQDLADIWQGVMAKPMKKIERESDTFAHDLKLYEFFHGKDMPTDLQWMVFKVKKKAEKSYYNITADTQDDKRFKFEFDLEEKQPEYNYNWPYDFCSLVELANIGAEIEFKHTGSV